MGHWIALGGRRALDWVEEWECKGFLWWWKPGSAWTIIPFEASYWSVTVILCISIQFFKLKSRPGMLIRDMSATGQRRMLSLWQQFQLQERCARHHYCQAVPESTDNWRYLQNQRGIAVIRRKTRHQTAGRVIVIVLWVGVPRGFFGRRFRCSAWCCFQRSRSCWLELRWARWTEWFVGITMVSTLALRSIDSSKKPPFPQHFYLTFGQTGPDGYFTILQLYCPVFGTPNINSRTKSLCISITPALSHRCSYFPSS